MSLVSEPSTVLSDRAARFSQPTGWEAGGEHVKAAVRGLTKVERQYVRDGSCHGDIRMQTIRSLQHKGMFYLKITSPNGRCGHMALTPLGLNAQALLKKRTSQKAQRDGSEPQNNPTGEA